MMNWVQNPLWEAHSLHWYIFGYKKIIVIVATKKDMQDEISEKLLKFSY